MSAHAKRSPSGADGWMNCSGWESDPTSSIYAAEGTAAHTLAAWCLTEHKPAAAYEGRVIHVEEWDFTVDDEMITNVQVYTETILEHAEGNFLLVEQRVPIGHITGEEGAEGTSDALILTADGQELQVHDLKYGRGKRVQAQENRQLRLYALGCLELALMLGYDPQRIRLLIHQPRLNALSEWDCTREELEAFAEEVRNPPPEKKAGDEQCQWCRHRGNCETQDEYVAGVIAEDFGALVFAKENGVSVNIAESDMVELEAKMENIPFIKQWMAAVAAQLERKLFAGETSTLFKVVQGNQGPRAWDDETEAEKALKAMRLKADDMYTKKVISPTAAEKLLKKESPKRWESLQPHITRAPGKLTVAHVSDKRPAVEVGKPEDDFQPVQAEGG